MKAITKIITALLIVALLYLVSWGVTVGIIKLITLCFGIKFNLIHATGLWLVVCLVKLLFGKSKSK